MPRYIDADVLRTKIKDFGIKGVILKPTEWNDARDWGDAVWTAVSETPTADVSERKKEK